MFTIRPPSASRSAVACIIRNGPRALTATSRSKSASDVPATDPQCVIPALLTRMSSRPNSPVTTSAASALPDRYVNPTSAPSAASRRVISAPMPRLPPVTRATLPASRPVFSMRASTPASRPGQKDEFPIDPYTARMDDLELRELRYFIAVAEELNFTRAAMRLGMAQPPLSAAIGKLERKLGVTLLERTSRRVALTPAGTVLLEQGRIVVEA